VGVENGKEEYGLFTERMYTKLWKLWWMNGMNLEEKWEQIMSNW